ncbi:MAG: Hsp20/alpha crystallin family protein [Chloroflexi bacterium]|nr:Hsp20/alpha crystallin family protein [Chloroflexota bacterium]
MVSLTRWEPFREMAALNNVVDQLLGDWGQVPVMRRWPVAGLASNGAGRLLAVDLYVTDKDVVVKAAVPGASPEDVEVKVTGDVLSIRGETKEEKDVQTENYYLRERRHGTFSRSIALPVPVQADKAEAVFEHGILTLTLPKVEEVRPKTIKVQTKK